MNFKMTVNSLLSLPETYFEKSATIFIFPSYQTYDLQGKFK